MKTPISIFAFLVAHTAIAQNANVQVELAKQEFSRKDTVEFNIAVSSPIELEISLFRPDSIVLLEKSKLHGSFNTYRIPAVRIAPGTYNILISGEGIHEERTIRVMR
jgi:hypothetical protein